MVGASENGRKVMRRKREGEGFSRGWGNPNLGQWLLRTADGEKPAGAE